MKLSEFVSHFAASFMGRSIPVIYNGVVFRMTVTRAIGVDHVSVGNSDNIFRLDCLGMPLSNSRASDVVQSINDATQFHLSPVSRSGYSTPFTLYVTSDRI